MKLNESTPTFSTEEGERIFWECVKNLSSLGPEYTLTEKDFSFKGWFEATGLQGQTHTEMDLYSGT